MNFSKQIFRNLTIDYTEFWTLKIFFKTKGMKNFAEEVWQICKIGQGIKRIVILKYDFLINFKF